MCWLLTYVDRWLGIPVEQPDRSGFGRSGRKWNGQTLMVMIWFSREDNWFRRGGPDWLGPCWFGLTLTGKAGWLEPVDSGDGAPARVRWRRYSGDVSLRGTAIDLLFVYLKAKPPRRQIQALGPAAAQIDHLAMIYLSLDSWPDKSCFSSPCPIGRWYRSAGFI